MKLISEATMRDVLTRMHKAVKAGGPGSGVYDHHKLGSVHQVQSGSGFNQRNLVALKTHDGYRQINQYLPQNKDKFTGTLGQPMDLEGKTIVGQLHDGLGADGKVGNVFHLAALPPGAKVTQEAKTSVPERHYTKTEDGKFKDDDSGNVVEHYHFTPDVFDITAKKPQ